MQILTDWSPNEGKQMTNAPYSCVIPVKEEHVTDETGTDHFRVLTSDVLPGFVLGGRDLEALHSDVPDAIRILFKEDAELLNSQ